MKVKLTEKEIAALMWAAGAIEQYKEGKEKATIAQANNALRVIRRLYMPSIMAQIKEVTI